MDIPFSVVLCLLAEVSLQQACECFAVTSLVSCHLMNGVMDCIQIGSFRTFCQIGLSGGSAVFSFYSHLKVLLGAVGYDFAQQLSKFCSRCV